MPVLGNSLIALFFLGFLPTLIKSTQASVATIGFVRLLFAVVFFYAYVRWRGKKIRWTRAHFLPCMIIGLCFGFHWLCYFLSIRFSTVAVASFCMSTNGLIMVFLARLFFHEKITFVDGIALALTLLGSLLVLPNYTMGDRAFWGFVLGMLNAFLFAVMAILQKFYAPTIPNETRTFSQYVFALPLFICLGPEFSGTLGVQDWLSLAFMGIFCTALAHTLWIRSLEILPAKTAAVLYYLSTFFAVLIGALVLKEIPSLRIMIGGGLIICGGILAIQSSQKVKSSPCTN